MPFPSKTYSHNVIDDCFRLAVARVLDVHPKTVKFIKPGTPDFWIKWHLYLENKYSKQLLPIDSEIAKQFNIKWIAIVDSRDGGTHAIVMNGKHLDYDPNHKSKDVRTRAPRKILGAYVIT